MNNDLISRSALIKKLSRMLDYCQDNGLENEMSALFQVGDAIMDCPAVDAVAVCRCKDCKYGILHSFYTSYKCTRDAEYDEALGGYVGFTKWNKPDDFCASGERKGDDA